MSNKYEGTVGSYRFVMSDSSTIEVWSDGEHPESYLFIKEDTVKSEKDFQKEISYWAIDNGIIG